MALSNAQMNGADHIVLAFETAVGSGSLSLQVNGVEVDQRNGNVNVARAENLLPEIYSILSAHQLNVHDVDLFAVSTGPGSYTGIRIGIATSLGFRSALNSKVLGVNSLQAMALGSSSRHTAAAVPMGRGIVCIQEFRGKKPIAGPRLLTPEQWSEFSIGFPGTLVFEGSLRNALSNSPTHVIDVGYNIAKLIGEAAGDGFGSQQLVPIFVDRT